MRTAVSPATAFLLALSASGQESGEIPWLLCEESGNAISVMELDDPYEAARSSPPEPGNNVKWEFSEGRLINLGIDPYSGNRYDFGPLSPVGLWAFSGEWIGGERFILIQFEDPRFRRGVMLTSGPDGIMMEHIRCEPCADTICGPR